MLNNSRYLLTNSRQNQNNNLRQVFQTIENCGRVTLALSSLSFIGSIFYSIAKTNIKKQNSSSLNNSLIDSSTSVNQTLASLAGKNSLKSNLYVGIIFSIAVFGLGVFLTLLGKSLQNFIDSSQNANEFTLRNSLIRVRQLNFSNFSYLQNSTDDLENFDNEPLEQEHNPPVIQNDFGENPTPLENDSMPITYSNPVLRISANQLVENQGQLIT